MIVKLFESLLVEFVREFLVSLPLSGQVVKRAIGSNDSSLLPESKRRTVLLTEVGVDPRTLYVARALGKAGHKIIVASGDHNQVVKASR